MSTELSRCFTAVSSAIRADSLASALIALGLVLRIGRYLQERSLWLDETYLALNLMTRSYSGLTEGLDFEQGAPLGFLVLEKFAISAFGDSERAFRLFPLLAGFASVVVFWRLALRLLDRRSALLALAFFAILEPFVYYSSETKQYSFDVLVALVIFLLFDHVLSSDRLRWSAALFVAGAVAPLFSHPSIFALAGTGIALLLAAAAARDVRKLIFVSMAGVAWLVSFLVVYVTSTRNLNPHLSTGLRGENVDPVRVLKNTYVLFNDPGALPRDLIGLILVLVGLGALISLRDSWPRLAAMTGIAITAVVAGELRYYPLAGRWALFLLPFAVMLLALGATSFVRTTRMPLKALAIVAVGFLLAVPAWKAVRNLERVPATEPGTPATLQPTRSLLGRLEHLWKPGDTLYVSVKSQFQFRYYLTCDDCNAERAKQFRLWPFRSVPGPLQTSPALVPERPNLVVGQAPGDVDSYLDDFERLSGHARVWLLLIQTWPVEEALLADELSRQGRSLAVIHEGASALLLYDLRSQESSAG